MEPLTLTHTLSLFSLTLSHAQTEVGDDLCHRVELGPNLQTLRES